MDGGSPTTNYGTAKKLNADQPDEETYVRFGVAGVSGTVQQATLRLWVTNGSTNGPSVYGTTNEWTEGGLTWNNRPAATTGVLDTVQNAPSGSWVEYDVTGHVTGEGTFSLVLLPNSTKGVGSRPGGGAEPATRGDMAVGRSAAADEHPAPDRHPADGHRDRGRLPRRRPRSMGTPSC